jgi:hypothetical protein
LGARFNGSGQAGAAAANHHHIKHSVCHDGPQTMPPLG